MKTVTVNGIVYEDVGTGVLTAIGEARPDGHRRTSWTAAELLEAEFADPRFAIEGLVPEGLAFMCGAPKLGKSWLALGLSIAIAGGGVALGTIPVEAGEALYLALEDSPRRLQSRLRMLLAGEGAPGGLHIETAWPRLDEGGTDQLDAWLTDHPDARIVLIDVWPRIRPRVARRTDYFQADYDSASPLQSLATAHGIAIVALFHTRKAEAEDFVETVQGTFGTAAAADTIIVVKRSRGQADATLYVTARDVEEQELALRFAPAAGTWALLGDAAEYAMGKTRRELLEAIRAHGALTPKQAAEVISTDHELVKVTLWRMSKDGQLQANQGRYSVGTPVTPVTELPGAGDECGGQGDSGNRVTAVTGVLEGCIRCQRYGPDHVGEHVTNWGEGR
jgi:AAA domain